MDSDASSDEDFSAAIALSMGAELRDTSATVDESLPDVQIAKNNKKYFVLDSSKNNTNVENQVYNIVSKYLKIK